MTKVGIVMGSDSDLRLWQKPQIFWKNLVWNMR